ncbi:MAG TPA: FAD-dependent monooxygenase [Rhizobiaceae bacterium]|nr:FAD-dependent monooxygenase [Rhizobiaceae bacterium]
MEASGSQQILIAGAGIAGLTAALAFAAKGFSVRIFERSARLAEVGAGLQLSPNATRLLRQLDVLDDLMPAAKPAAIALIDGWTLRTITRVPLGDAAEKRWGAPYLVAHRADLQNALAAKVTRHPDITLTLGALVRDVSAGQSGITASVKMDGQAVEANGLLLVGADGVWSRTRALLSPSAKSEPIGRIAWRSTVRTESPAGRAFAEIADMKSVSAFLHPAAHVVAYPLRSGSAINLVAVTSGAIRTEDWASREDPQLLFNAIARMEPRLRANIREAGLWTAWPLHTGATNAPWTAPNIALIGDAAHAMTPFAAQGAAMAIEDAVTLAEHVSAQPANVQAALSAWEAERRPRLARVLKRGALNRFAWHAAGPVAIARNVFLKARGPEKLAADLDWLYGWDPAPPVKSV